MTLGGEPIQKQKVNPATSKQNKASTKNPEKNARKRRENSKDNSQQITSRKKQPT